MQKPTVGRVVHFFPAPTDALYRNGEPLAATIVRVWSETCVNLALFDGEARLHSRTSVLLYQEGNARPDASFAAWPAREGVQFDTKMAITDEMVGRFLSWPLPEDFAPDCGISFTRSPHAGMNPTGTNLLYFGQAKAMLEHCINGSFVSPAQPAVGMDETVEQLIQAAGADVAPRVGKADIDALMARVVYTYEQRPNGSTATLCHAFLDGKYYLVTGMSATVSAENFNAEIGRDLAMNKAMQLTRDKLWELEGYRLHATMAADAEFIGGSMAIID